MPGACSRFRVPASACFRSAKKRARATILPARRSPLLSQLSLNFIGNVEGRDIYNGRADVVVCDGFVGNVALKTSEGLARLVRDLLRQSLNSTVTAQVGALLSRKAFNDFKKRLDYSEYGGAPLLGIRGVCIVNHGSSNDRAIYNGIRVTAEFALAGINQRLEQEFACRRPADGASEPEMSEPIQPLISEGKRNRRSLHALQCFVSGHDFSRAAKS